MIRKLALIVIALALALVPAVAHAAISSQKAVANIRRALDRKDSSSPWKIKLLGNVQAKVRPFRANNVRRIVLPNDAVVHAGGTITGTINKSTGFVKIVRQIALAKKMPR